MKRFFNLDLCAAIFTLLVCFFLVTSCHQNAYSGECKVIQHNQEQVVIQPFAVPVGVPVSPYSAYFYSASPQQMQSYAAPPPDPIEELARKLAPLLNGHVNAAAKPQSLFAAKCIVCHQQGDADKGKPQFTDLDLLTCEQRVKAIHAIVSGEMPKGGKLDDQSRGKLIDELTAPQKEVPPTPNP